MPCGDGLVGYCDGLDWNVFYVEWGSSTRQIYPKRSERLFLRRDKCRVPPTVSLCIGIPNIDIRSIHTRTAVGGFCHREIGLLNRWVRFSKFVGQKRGFRRKVLIPKYKKY